RHRASAQHPPRRLIRNTSPTNHKISYETSLSLAAIVESMVALAGGRTFGVTSCAGGSDRFF
ncbi:hypothetical protein AB0383_49665, partial [Amycolatopsis sp. NPDC051373]|uniref:hypothetical protein n=1 Tax=Amycolatopsis sp. NPDC051373 TaxID=3155801 RepID=UPI00344B7728